MTLLCLKTPISYLIACPQFKVVWCFFINRSIWCIFSKNTRSDTKSFLVYHIRKHMILVYPIVGNVNLNHLVKWCPQDFSALKLFFLFVINELIIEIVWVRVNIYLVHYQAFTHNFNVHLWFLSEAIFLWWLPNWYFLVLLICIVLQLELFLSSTVNTCVHILFTGVLSLLILIVKLSQIWPVGILYLYVYACHFFEHFLKKVSNTTRYSRLIFTFPVSALESTIWLIHFSKDLWSLQNGI